MKLDGLVFIWNCFFVTVTVDGFVLIVLMHWVLPLQNWVMMWMLWGRGKRTTIRHLKNVERHTLFQISFLHRCFSSTTKFATLYEIAIFVMCIVWLKCDSYLGHDCAEEQNHISGMRRKHPTTCSISVILMYIGNVYSQIFISFNIIFNVMTQKIHFWRPVLVYNAIPIF